MLCINNFNKYYLMCVWKTEWKYMYMTRKYKCVRALEWIMACRASHTLCLKISNILTTPIAHIIRVLHKSKYTLVDSPLYVRATFTYLLFLIMATKTFLNMRIAPRVMCLLVIAVVVYGLVYMSFIRQERSNDNRLQRPEDLEVLRRLKRIEVLVYKIGEFLLIAYITTHYFFIISTLACFHFQPK